MKALFQRGTDTAVIVAISLIWSHENKCMRGEIPNTNVPCQFWNPQFNLAKCYQAMSHIQDTPVKTYKYESTMQTNLRTQYKAI